MPIKQKHLCEVCGRKQESTRVRVVRCASWPACECAFPSDRPETLCDVCAKDRKETR
jgi:hypothetical protein